MSKQYDGSKFEQSINVERHIEVGHQRFFKDDSNDSTIYNERCFRKWFTMKRGLFLHFMDLIYALDRFCRDVRIVLYSELVHNIYE